MNRYRAWSLWNIVRVDPWNLSHRRLQGLEDLEHNKLTVQKSFVKIASFEDYVR